MKTNLLYLLVLLLLMGCKKGPEPDSHCYPQSMLMDDVFGHYKLNERYTYNAQGQLINIEGLTYGIRFSYDDSGKMILSQKYNYGDLLWTTKYSYDAKGRLIRADVFQNQSLVKEPESEPVRYHTFAYSANGNEIESVLYTRSYPTPYKKLLKYWYTYRSEQQLTISSESYFDPYKTETSKVETIVIYDDKKSPHWAIPAVRTMNMVDNFKLSHKHNILSYSTPSDYPQLNHKGADSYTSTYEYTPLGYAKSELRHYFLNKNKRTYTYSITCD